jgi:uncharacterized protein (DUF2141 family)
MRIFSASCIVFMSSSAWLYPKKIKGIYFKLKVSVNEIRNSDGEINFNLFNNADGFPNAGTTAIRHWRGKINNGIRTSRKRWGIVVQNVSKQNRPGQTS